VEINRGLYMKLNLTEIAKSVEESYKEIELILPGGEKFTTEIYHVPEPIIWQYKPDRPEPERPQIMMEIVGGRKQARDIKSGDPGWEEWLKESQEYDNELSDIRLAARYVLALRGIEYPDLTSPPPLMTRLTNDGYPESELLRKKAWLDYTIFAIASNVATVYTAILQLGNSLSANDVEEVKKNSVSTAKED
jgi:hypothetical protein